MPHSTSAGTSANPQQIFFLTLLSGVLMLLNRVGHFSGD